MHMSNQVFCFSLSTGRIVSSPSQLSVGRGNSATLTCVEYGYISLQPITWIRAGADDVIMDNERYDITGGFNSANYEAQTGETTPSPAFISTLTIKQVMLGDFGVYVCQSGGNSLVDAVLLERNTSVGEHKLNSPIVASFIILNL